MSEPEYTELSPYRNRFSPYLHDVECLKAAIERHNSWETLDELRDRVGRCEVADPSGSETVCGRLVGHEGMHDNELPDNARRLWDR